MKITEQQAIKAILDLTMEMSAHQRAMNTTLLSSLARSESEASQLIRDLNLQTELEIELV